MRPECDNKTCLQTAQVCTCKPRRKRIKSPTHTTTGRYARAHTHIHKDQGQTWAPCPSLLIRTTALTRACKWLPAQVCDQCGCVISDAHTHTHTHTSTHTLVLVNTLQTLCTDHSVCKAGQPSPHRSWVICTVGSQQKWFLGKWSFEAEKWDSQFTLRFCPFVQSLPITQTHRVYGRLFSVRLTCLTMSSGSRQMSVSTKNRFKGY